MSRLLPRGGGRAAAPRCARDRLLSSLDAALCVPCRGSRAPRPAALRGGVSCAAVPPAGDGAARRRSGGGAAGRTVTDASASLSLARQDLEQDARHWAYLNSVGLQPETVHSLLQRGSEADEGAAGDGGGEPGARRPGGDGSLGVAPTSLAELVEVVEYLVQNGHGRNKDVITGLRTFFTRNETARFLAALGVRDVGRTLVRFPQLLRYDVEAVLAPRAAYLRDVLGVVDVGLAISRHPCLLMYHSQHKVAPLAAYLRDELRVRDVGRLVTRCPAVLSASLDAKVRPTVAFLLQQGLLLEDFDRLLAKHPALFTHSLNDKLVPVVDFLIDLGVKDVGRVLRAMPQLLGCSLEHNLQPSAEYLRELGVADVGRFVQSFPAALGYSVKRKLGRTASWLRAAGVRDVGALLTALPALAGYSVPANLEPKRRLLVAVMGRPIDDAVRFPAFWGYSLQGRILPRYAFLLEQGAAEGVSLASMLAAPDERFLQLPALRAAVAAGAPATPRAFQQHVASPAFAARLAALERSGKLWSEAPSPPAGAAGPSDARARA